MWLEVCPLECGCGKMDGMDEGACYERPKKKTKERKKKNGLDVLGLYFFF